LSVVKCPYCFDALGPNAVACAQCRTALHDECSKEHGRCVVLGCASRIFTGPRRWRDKLVRSLTHALLGLVVAALFVFVVLTATVHPCMTASGSCRAMKVLADHDALKKAANLFRLHTGHYPRRMDELWKRPAGEPRWDGPYIDPDPRDPWGEPYVLAADGCTIALSIKTVGAW
jgi:hypothetical protein